MDLLQQVDSAIEALDEEGIDADAERHNGSRQQLDTDAALQPEPGGMDEEGKAHDVQPAPDVMQAAAAVSAALTGAASPGLHTFGSRMSAGDMHADRSPGARHRANPEAKPFRVHQRHGVKFSLVGQEGDKDCGDELDDCGSSGCSGTDSELMSARPDTAQSGAVVLPVVQNVTPDSEAIRQGGGRRGHPVSPAPALGRTVRASVTISAGSKAEPNGAEAGSNATMHDDGSDSEGDGEQPAETPARKAELGMARCWPRCCRSNRVVPLFSTKALASQSKHCTSARSDTQSHPFCAHADRGCARSPTGASHVEQDCGIRVLHGGAVRSHLHPWYAPLVFAHVRWQPPLSRRAHGGAMGRRYTSYCGRQVLHRGAELRSEAPHFVSLRCVLCTRGAGGRWLDVEQRPLAPGAADSD